MPSVGSIPSRTVISLLATVERGKVEPMIVTGSLVYDARDAIAQHAVDNDYDYVLYVDSDMVFNAEDLKRLLAHQVGICSGLYVTRDGEDRNVAYNKIITRRRFPYRAPKLIEDSSTSGFAPVSAVGFGFCLIKCSVLKSMFKHYKSLFEPFKGVGEDVAFCIRARRLGYKTFIDRDVKLGHVGEKVYQ
jgi:GT2 family glycosyltransferase